MRSFLLPFLSVVLLLGPGVPAARSQTGPASMSPVENAGPAAIVKEGRYELKYFGRTLGDETFRVERLAGGGYRIEAKLTKAPQDQPAAESVYILDADRGFVSATYRPLEGDSPSAEYFIKDGTLVARSSNGLEQQVPLTEGDLVAGPHYMTDFWILAPLPLAEGEQTQRTIHTFGFKDWTVTPCSVEIRRTDDRKSSGVPVSVFRCKITNATDTFNTTSYIPEDGFSLKISISAPIGSANAKLTPLPAAGARR